MHDAPPLRVAPDDPAYLERSAAECEFWMSEHPMGLEATERLHREGPIHRYWSRRFTGDETVHWAETLGRHGRFRRGAILGTSTLGAETRILDTNPDLHVTFIDLSEGGLERRREALSARFRGRVATRVADLNFIAFEPGEFDCIVSSSTIHHVTNLEHLAYQIDRALAPDGRFFLEDYVGEVRHRCREEKKRVFQHLFNRDRIRSGLPPCDLEWFDESNLSPFCGVRSDEILPIFRTYLDEMEVRTAGALVTPLQRTRPIEDNALSPFRGDDWLFQQPLWRLLLGIARNRYPRIFGRNPPLADWLNPEFLQEIFLLSDVLTELGQLEPALAFATYRKRR